MNDIVYYGTNTGIGPQQVKIHLQNDEHIRLRHSIILHSPDGFQWGYGGSGPADLALNMLYDYLRRKDNDKKSAKCIAVALHQKFKWQFIARAVKEHLQISGADIEQWLSQKKIIETIDRKAIYG